MAKAHPHEMMISEEHDEHSLISFAASLKKHLAENVALGNRYVFDQTLSQDICQDKNRGSRERRAMLDRMAKNNFWQIASVLKLLAQELMWDSVGSCAERQVHILNVRAHNIFRRNKKKGSLRVNPTIQIPRYLSAVDIHHMPGGYTQQYSEKDVYAGALFDRGILVFQMKSNVDINDRMGKFIVKNIRERFPDLAPKRILEIGCSIGASTIAFADAWPKAEVHAIDISLPLLRYAHARAESLQWPIHFSQQNAEQTNFPDSFFDLIVSIGTLHETSNRAVRKIFAECNRLLGNDGVMIHGEGLQHKDLSLYEEVTFDWDTHFNAEPFIGTLHDLDLWRIMEEAGFKKHLLFEDHVMRGLPSKKTNNRVVEFNQSGKYMLIGSVR